MTTISLKKLSFPFSVVRNERLIDLHVHTNYSPDGFLSPARLIKIAKRLNVGLAICDHNEIQGALEASRQNEVAIIPGIEVTCQNGTHLLFYFKKPSELKKFFQEVVEPYKKNNPLITNLFPQELLERAREFSGLVCVPHPFENLRGGIQKAIQGGLLSEEEVIKKIDCVEAINGMGSGEQNKKAILWAQKINKPTVAGSDGHLARQIGTVVTRIKGENSEEFFENLTNPQELIGTEMTGLKRNMTRAQKELKIFFKKGGLKILINQIQRSLKK